MEAGQWPAQPASARGPRTAPATLARESPSGQHGTAFVASVTSELAGLQAGVSGLKEALIQLGGELQAERQMREVSVSALSERLARMAVESAETRANTSARQDDFEGKTKQWVGALAKESKSLKEQLAALCSNVDTLTEQQGAAREHIAELELSLRQKFEIGDAEKLAASISSLQAEATVDREAAEAAVARCRQDCGERLAAECAALRAEAFCDRAAAVATTEACGEKLGRELDGLASRVGAVAKQQEQDKSALDTGIIVQSGRIDALAKVSAKELDLEALDGRVASGLQGLQEELREKAAAATLNSVSERLTELTMKVGSNSERAEAGDAKLAGEVELLSRSLAKTARQLDTEREHWNASALALEKGLAEHKVVMVSLGVQVTAVEAAHGALQGLVGTKAGSEEVASQRAKVDAIQNAVINKADLTVTAALELSLLGHKSKIEEMQEQAAAKEKASAERTLAEKQATEERFSAIDALVGTLQEGLEPKLEAAQVYSRVETDRMLKEFYCKQEMDAQVSRIWWRLGDSKSSSLSQRAMAR